MRAEDADEESKKHIDISVAAPTSCDCINCHHGRQGVEV